MEERVNSILHGTKRINKVEAAVNYSVIRNDDAKDCAAVSKDLPKHGVSENSNTPTIL